MAVSQATMTLEAFLQLPEEEPALEFEDGMVLQKVSPKSRHSVLQGALIEHINRQFKADRRASAFPELRVTFGGRSYVPDVAVILWDRIPVDDDGIVVDDIVEPPDIAIEIVSPKQSVTALVRRCVWYVENGVQITLLVDPDDRSVIRFRRGQAPAVLRGSDRIALDDVLDNVSLTVDMLFSSMKYR